MTEATLRSLKLAAKFKLAEVGIAADPMQFERFWEKFMYNLLIAWRNEQDAMRLAFEEKVAIVWNERADYAKVAGLSFAIGWVIGRLQGIF